MHLNRNRDLNRGREFFINFGFKTQGRRHMKSNTGVSAAPQMHYLGKWVIFHVVCFNCISMAFMCPVLDPDTASVKGF